MIETKTIQMVFAGKINKVLRKEMSALRLIEIDHRAPARVAIEKAFSGERPKDVVGRPGMVEDDINQHSQPIAVTSIY